MAMDEEPRNMFQYRILRYAPNRSRDEWMNIGVLLEETSGARQAMRLIEEPAEFARVRRLHPDADEDLLHGLAPEFDARLRRPAAEVALYLQKLDQNLSNMLELSPPKGLLAENFDAELDRLDREQVTPPVRRAGGLLQNTRDWMRSKLNDVFRRHRVLGKLEHRVRVEGLRSRGTRCGWITVTRMGCAGLSSRFRSGAICRRRRLWLTWLGALMRAMRWRKSPLLRIRRRTLRIRGTCSSKNFSPTKVYGLWP
jgi:hypothetical protein